MKKILNIIILTSLIISCNHENFEKEIIRAYNIESEVQNDSISIEKIKILKISNVDGKQFKTIRINSLNNAINLRRKQIEMLIKQRDLTIDIISSNKVLMNLYSIKNSKNEREVKDKELEKNKIELRIKEFEDDINYTSQQIVLIKADSKAENEINKKLIEYVFYGSINNDKIIDTLQIMFNNEFDYNFIRNDRFSLYHLK